MSPKTDTEAPTEFPPSGRNTKDNAHREPPKGLSFENRKGKLKPFLARWREPGGHKKSQSFATEEQRWAFVGLWQKREAMWGKAAPMVHPKSVHTWRIFSEMTEGADPLEVARFYLKYRRERGGNLALTGEKGAISRFLELRAKATRSQDANSHTKLHLKRFAAAFDGKTLADVTADSIRAWMDGLKDPETALPLAPYTLRHHLRTVKHFFAVATRERWLDESPAESIDLPKIDAGEIHVLSVDDAVKLFAANRDALCVGRLALEAFGGLRYTSAARLTKDEILAPERGIVMPGAKHKSGRRHYVDGYPDNLWQWIERAPEACWQIHPRQYLDLKAQAFADAGVSNPGNVLRHSFCTYHVAVNKDAARTAVLLTHRSPSMLYQHYKGRATEADGRRYFEIAP